MTSRKGLFYGIVLLLTCILCWFGLRRHDKRVDQSTMSTMLPARDKEKIILNQHTHTITEVTRDKKTGREVTKKLWYGPKSSIEIHTDGSPATVTTRSFGTEISPSIGVLYGSDLQLRGEMSLGLLYYTRYEFSVGLAMASQLNSARAIIGATYNCYDNILVGVYLDNHHDCGIMAGLRF